MIKFYAPVPSTSFQPGSRYSRCVFSMTPSFDPTTFWRGRRFEEALPAGIQLKMSDGDFPDFFGTQHWEIFSSRAARLIEDRAGDAIQFFDAPLCRVGTGELIEGYEILNATRAILCVDFSKSQVSYREGNPQELDRVHKWVFDASIIPTDLHVFRAAEYLPALYFSKQLMEDLLSVEPPLKDLAFLEYGGDEVVTIRRLGNVCIRFANRIYRSRF